MTFSRLIAAAALTLAFVGSASAGPVADFETAIQFGASYVRIGSAIFGARD